MAHPGNNKQRARGVRQRIASGNGAIVPPRQGNAGGQSDSIALRPRIPRLNKNGAPIRSGRTSVRWDPQTELEAATQRFVDLYDFAPIAYVSFDRAGRIEEANLATTALLGVARDS